MPEKTKNTELLKSNLLLLVECFSIIFLLLLASQNISHFLNTKNVLGAKTETVDTHELQTNFWKNILKNNPDYFDGWVELSKIQLSEEDLSKAQESFEKAKFLNPNSEQIFFLEESFK